MTMRQQNQRLSERSKATRSFASSTACPLMSPRAMGDFIVRAADARVAFYDGTWILIAMIEQSYAPRVSSTVAEAFR